MYISDLPAGTPGSSAELAFDTGAATYKTGLEDLYRGMMTESGAYVVHNSVDALGLPVGSANIAGAWGALGNNEILLAPASDFVTGSGGVPAANGTVEIVKLSSSRGYIYFWGKTDAVNDQRMFLTSGNAPTGVWEKVAEVLDLGTFTGTATTFTLLDSGYYLIGTTHSTGAVSVGLWIYSTSGSMFVNISGGSAITLTGNGTTITAKSGGATVGLYAIKVR